MKLLKTPNSLTTLEYPWCNLKKLRLPHMVISIWFTIGLYCPRQWMRSCSYYSTTGFHRGSIRNTCDAIVRFIPTPPTFTFIENTWKKPTIKVRKFTYTRCGWLQTPSINDNKCLGALWYNLIDTCDVLQFLKNRFNEGSCEHTSFLPNWRKT
jgi:hypothetical protein